MLRPEATGFVQRSRIETVTEPDKTSTGPETRASTEDQEVQKRSRYHRRLETGKILQNLFGEEGAATLKARNWTLTGAVLVALGVVSDLLQIFGEISTWGLSLSVIAAVILGLIVAFHTQWKAACVAPFVSALLFVAMFTAVLFVQRAANASDEGAIAKAIPVASDIQRLLYVRIVSLEQGQKSISAKIDQLTQQLERQNASGTKAAVDPAFVGSWSLLHPTLVGWNVAYLPDGTYVLTTPDGQVTGTYKAADGWFVSSAPSVGASDVGAYRFVDGQTLEMNGKLGVSVWQRMP